MKTNLLLALIVILLSCCTKDQTNEPVITGNVTPTVTPSYVNHGVYCMIYKDDVNKQWSWPAGGCKTDSMVAVRLGDTKIQQGMTTKYVVINTDSCEKCAQIALKIKY